MTEATSASATEEKKKKGRISVVTGASKGIGAGTARMLGGNGDMVFVHYCGDREGALAVVREIEARGGIGHAVCADLSSVGGAKALFDAVSARTDHIDLLVNNAAVSPFQMLGVQEASRLLLEHVFQTDVYSLAQLTVLFIPLLERSVRSPSVININSCVIRSGNGSGYAYGVAKGAVDALTRCQAKQLAPKIRVNGLAPGMIETPIQQYTPQAWKDFCCSITPMRRNGVPDDIARGVIFLADNPFINGFTLGVDGGIMMR